MTRSVRRFLWLLALCSCSRGPSGQPAKFPTLIPDLVSYNEELGDPYGGRYPFDFAVDGLPGEGQLVAVLSTDEGQISCVLDPGRAPLTVANFIGLARGNRPFRTSGGRWESRPFYRDLDWFKAGEGRFIQSGRPRNEDNVGFRIQDEVTSEAEFDGAGILAMVRDGSEHSASSVFLITTTAAPELDGKHTIFGQCDSFGVLQRLEARVDDGDPPTLRSIEIERRKPPSVWSEVAAR